MNFKSEVFDNTDLFSTPVKDKRVEKLRKSIRKSTPIKPRDSGGDFRH